MKIFRQYLGLGQSLIVLAMAARGARFDRQAGHCTGGEDVGFTFRRRKRLARGTNLNLSKSGASLSKRVGPVTVNSRGRISLRLGKGFGFRL